MLSVKALIFPVERVGALEAGHMKVWPAYRIRLAFALGVAEDSIDWTTTAADRK